MNGGSYQASCLSVNSDAAKTIKMKEFILYWYNLKGISAPEGVAKRFQV